MTHMRIITSPARWMFFALFIFFFVIRGMGLVQAESPPDVNEEMVAGSTEIIRGPVETVQVKKSGTQKTAVSDLDDISRALAILDKAGRETDLDPLAAEQALAGDEYDKAELDRITSAVDKAYEALMAVEKICLAHSTHPELLSEVLRVAGFAASWDPAPTAGEILIDLYQKEKVRINQILDQKDSVRAKRLLLYFESAESVRKYGNDPDAGYIVDD